MPDNKSPESLVAELKTRGIKSYDRETALARLDGDLELHTEIVGLYLEDAPLQLRGIRQGIETGDAQLTERSAHSLKSASANIGAELMRELAFDAERLGKRKDLQQIEKLLPTLELAFAELAAELRNTD
jgi:HPt (histidine-containing phosphotransfer) domain-containing protein